MNIKYISAFSLFLVKSNISRKPLLRISDKYKPDPSDAAGTRSEQLRDSDGGPPHWGAMSDEHGGPWRAPGRWGVWGDRGRREGGVWQVWPGEEHWDPPSCGRPGSSWNRQGKQSLKRNIFETVMCPHLHISFVSIVLTDLCGIHVGFRRPKGHAGAHREEVCQ